MPTKKIEKLFNISLRYRLVFLFIALFGTATFIFEYVNFKILIKALEEENDINLYNLAVDVYNTEDINLIDEINWNSIEHSKKKIFGFNLDSALIQIKDTSGKILFRDGEFGNDDLPHLNIDPTDKKDAEYTTLIRNDYSISSLYNPEYSNDIGGERKISFRLITMNWNRPGTTLQIAIPRSHIEAVHSERRKLLLIGYPLVLFFAALGGILIASRALNPVRIISETARSIRADDLNKRVSIPNPKDELHDLAITFNQMLDRISIALQSQEKFVSDASHQLLTPLTLMKTELEIHLRNIQADVVTQRILRNQLDQTNYLIRITQDMLLLARIDAGVENFELKDHFVDEILITALERTEKIRATKKITLKFDIYGDQFRFLYPFDVGLIEQLFVILIENAVKYSPSESQLKVTLHWTPSHAKVSFQDQGTGIPKDMSESVFARFARGSFQNQKTQGYGLGLSIARKISAIHRTHLTIDQNVTTGCLIHLEINKI